MSSDQSTNVAATTKTEKCRNAGHDACTILVTCFGGLDVLIMVEFISKDLNYIAKESFVCFPCPEIL